MIGLRPAPWGYTPAWAFPTFTMVPVAGDLVAPAHLQSFPAAILLVCVVRIGVDIDPWLGQFPALYQWPVLAVGALLLLLSFTLVNYVQAYMHANWRSGIDRQEREGELLTSGPFGRSRNPAFLAVITGQLGFFLALPSVFSLVCLLVGVGVIVRQAREEEKALTERW